MVGSTGQGAQDGTFGLDKLSLSTGQVTEGRDEDVGAEGARGWSLNLETPGQVMERGR
jgi:hypothetical protein